MRWLDLALALACKVRQWRQRTLHQDATSDNGDQSDDQEKASHDEESDIHSIVQREKMKNRGNAKSSRNQHKEHTHSQYSQPNDVSTCNFSTPATYLVPIRAELFPCSTMWSDRIRKGHWQRLGKTRVKRGSLRVVPDFRAASEPTKRPAQFGSPAKGGVFFALAQFTARRATQIRQT